MAQHDDHQLEALARKARRDEKKDKQDRDNAVQALLGTGQGRRYVYWLLEITKAIGVNPFAADSHVTAFHCGEQNVGQQIMAHVIEVDADRFLLMLKEQEERKVKEDAAPLDE